MKSIKAKMQARKTSGGLLGAELAELCKNATSKNVPAPNEELMQQVQRRCMPGDQTCTCKLMHAHRVPCCWYSLLIDAPGRCCAGSGRSECVQRGFWC